MVAKSYPTNCYTNYKKKNSNFTGDRWGRQEEKGEKTEKEWGLESERERQSSNFSIRLKLCQNEVKKSMYAPYITYIPLLRYFI